MYSKAVNAKYTSTNSGLGIENGQAKLYIIQISLNNIVKCNECQYNQTTNIDGNYYIQCVRIRPQIVQWNTLWVWSEIVVWINKPKMNIINRDCEYSSTQL